MILLKHFLYLGGEQVVWSWCGFISRPPASVGAELAATGHFWEVPLCITKSGFHVLQGPVVIGKVKQMCEIWPQKAKHQHTLHNIRTAIIIHIYPLCCLWKTRAPLDGLSSLRLTMFEYNGQWPRSLNKIKSGTWPWMLTRTNKCILFGAGRSQLLSHNPYHILELKWPGLWRDKQSKVMQGKLWKNLCLVQRSVPNFFG